MLCSKAHDLDLGDTRDEQVTFTYRRIRANEIYQRFNQKGSHLTTQSGIK